MADYILNMGGSIHDTVDVFKVTESGVEHITDHGLSLSVARDGLAAASCGEYILAMGGYTGSIYSNAVDVFRVDENGVEAVQNHGLYLSTERDGLSSASCGNYILAMGGGTSGGYSNAVDIFRVTENGVEAVQNHGLYLSEPRNFLTAASCGEYILAMGGFDRGSYTDAVDVFKVTENGVEHITDHGLSLSVARGFLSSASCGEYVLAMGGQSTNTYSNAVDVFQC